METRSNRTSIRQSMLPSSRLSRVSVAHLSESMSNVHLDRPVRRSTARQSIYSSGSTFVKDPRPTREKVWQNAAVRKLISVLVQLGYSAPLSPKSLQNCSTKDFKSIFLFLYGVLDPNYLLDKKFEDELPGLLKALKYPFPDQFGKSSVYAIGSLHMWPIALAMLVWMVELVSATLEMEDLFPDEKRHESNPERMFFDYLIKTYSVFLAGSDSFEAMDQELSSDFERKNELILEDIGILSKENEEMSREFKALSTNPSPKDVFLKNNKTLEEDRLKFKKYIEHIEAKKEKLIENVASLKSELDANELEIQKLTSEKAHLHEIVDAQEISPADVDRMNAERDQLSLNLESTRTKLDGLNQIIWDKEIELQKKMDQVEKSVQEYNGMLYKLGLFGKSSKLGRELELYVQASTAQDMISVNLKDVVKPALSKLKEEFSNARHQSQDDRIALQEQMDGVTWSISQKEEELSLMEGRIKTLNDQYKQQKEHIGLKTQASNEEIEQYETQTQRYKIEANSSLIASQQKAQKVTIEYEQLSRSYTTQKEQYLERMVEGILATNEFRVRIMSGLESLSTVANDDVTRSKLPPLTF